MTIGKLSKARSKRAAELIRKGILDGRFDAELWGHEASDGYDSPRWIASLWWKGVGGEAYWLEKLYDAAYGRAHRAALKAIWENRSPEELREAKAVAEHNRKLRSETADQRERRLLLERVEKVEQELAGLRA